MLLQGDSQKDGGCSLTGNCMGKQPGQDIAVICLSSFKYSTTTGARSKFVSIWAICFLPPNFANKFKETQQ